ncbi:c-type cytochrome [Aestuariirhabdus sp. LZHN29]|uniref:c-type cytochrome n=1 Tax=Aestuariirhabdus sp. LZHN29 TaxID=3417462 RepID=UPI003CF1CA79
MNELRWMVVPMLLLVAGCSLPNEEERLAEQGLPPTDFVASSEQGRGLYQQYCAECHGRQMRGVELKGPPLMHGYYKPGHHADLAFYRAVKFGAQAHHWQFGDMPAQPEVSPKQVAHIVAFVRERQRRGGIQ